jgi:fructokinase
MICAIGDEKGNIIDRITVPTKTPEETIPPMVDYFRNKAAQGMKIEALGIACFGPIDLNKSSGTYGHITTTPKTPWINYDIVGVFKDSLEVPVGFDTDVNGSLLGEVTWGSSKGLTDVVYLTVGTGIGGGIMSGGKLVHGMMHPETGHLLIRPAKGDEYPGRCPFHGNCLEGMASGPAIEERWGRPAYELMNRAEVWELESEYIAQALMSYILILSPQRIILGGGVMHQKQMFDLVRTKVKEKLNGYIKTSELEAMDEYIVPASLNDDQGIMGAVRLAMEAVSPAADTDI